MIEVLIALLNLWGKDTYEPSSGPARKTTTFTINQGRTGKVVNATNFQKAYTKKYKAINHISWPFSLELDFILGQSPTM